MKNFITKLTEFSLPFTFMNIAIINAIGWKETIEFYSMCIPLMFLFGGILMNAGRNHEEFNSRNIN